MSERKELSGCAATAIIGAALTIFGAVLGLVADPTTATSGQHEPPAPKEPRQEWSLSGDGSFLWSTNKADWIAVDTRDRLGLWCERGQKVVAIYPLGATPKAVTVFDAAGSELAAFSLQQLTPDASGWFAIEDAGLQAALAAADGGKLQIHGSRPQEIGGGPRVAHFDLGGISDPLEHAHGDCK